jgi:hypothetical protein
MEILWVRIKSQKSGWPSFPKYTISPFRTASCSIAAARAAHRAGKVFTRGECRWRFPVVSAPMLYEIGNGPVRTFAGLSIPETARARRSLAAVIAATFIASTESA